MLNVSNHPPNMFENERIHDTIQTIIIQFEERNIAKKTLTMHMLNTIHDEMDAIIIVQNIYYTFPCFILICFIAY